jgi:hypothetical protein
MEHQYTDNDSDKENDAHHTSSYRGSLHLVIPLFYNTMTTDKYKQSKSIGKRDLSFNPVWFED